MFNFMSKKKSSIKNISIEAEENRASFLIFNFFCILITLVKMFIEMQNIILRIF